jgi:hypothetical protein
MSEVPRIELNADDTINISVRVDGFDVGTPVEISGHAIQENGAVTTFYSVQKLPADRVVWVKSIPAASEEKQFDAGFPITVVARAAEVSVTMLGAEDGSVGSLTRIAGGSGTLKGAWKSQAYHSALSFSQARAWDEGDTVG